MFHRRVTVVRSSVWRGQLSVPYSVRFITGRSNPVRNTWLPKKRRCSIYRFIALFRPASKYRLQQTKIVLPLQEKDRKKKKICKLICRFPADGNNFTGYRAAVRRGNRIPRSTADVRNNIFS